MSAKTKAPWGKPTKKKPPGVDPDAYDAYLEGRYFWNTRDREGLKEGLRCFKRALEIDPTCALAHAGVADSYAILGDNDWLSLRAALAKAKAAAESAVQIDHRVSEAHTSLAQAKELGWDWNGAEAEYKTALALNPRYATAHQWYSGLLSVTGRHPDAIAEAWRAARLDPLSPVIGLRVGQAYYFAGQYVEAIKAFQTILDDSPEFFWARYFLGVAYLNPRQVAEGIAELRKAAILSPGDFETKAALGYAYALPGALQRGAESQKILDELKYQGASPCLIALVYGGLGDKDEAFNCLEAALKQEDSDLPWIGVDPLFEPLRGDKRFNDLLRRMKLLPAPDSPAPSS